MPNRLQTQTPNFHAWATLFLPLLSLLHSAHSWPYLHRILQNYCAYPSYRDMWIGGSGTWYAKRSASEK
uniref:Putative secreted protein n=1 Tax=Anopheles darlingi TaxID=43151 RepID=A0A2M4DLK1_ANODA